MLRFLLAWTCCIPLLASAAESAATLNSTSLDYFRLQAFHSQQHEQRYALNHIGILGQQIDNGFLVSAILQGYPADSAGLNRGDIILGSDGEAFHEVQSFNNVALLPDRLEASQQSHELEILRGEQILQVSVAPVFENLFDSLRSATLASRQEFSAGNKVVGYVHFWALSRASNDLIAYQKLISALAHCDGIILDLRNSYGFLDVEHFQLVNPGVPALKLIAPSDWLQDWKQSSSPLDDEPYRKPVALLINEHTRGAGEILAQALGPMERVVTIGANTAGQLGDITIDSTTGELHYFPARETQVDGQILEGRGVSPEMAVSYPDSASRRDDPQFEAAVNLLLGII